MASHTHDEISASTCHLLESVGAQIGEVIVRARMEEDLRKSESKSRTLLENLPQKIFFKDRNSVYISCNENYARDLKIKSDEIRGRTDYYFHPKKLAEKYRADDKRIMELGKTEDLEEEYVRDGQKVFVHTVKTPVKDENGNVVGILGIFWDVTERKKAEEELIRLSSAVKVSTDNIVISGLDGKIIDANEATLKMYGTDDKRDLIGKSSFDLIAPEDRERALAGTKEVLEKGYIKSQEYYVITKDGSRIPVEMSAAIMKDADGKPIGFVGISRDITGRKQMEKKLEEYSQHLEELVERRTKQLKETQERLLKSERLAAIGEVATMVGHDLRNPLQSIENATYYLNNELTRFPPSVPIPQKTIEMLQVLNDSVNYADKVIRDLQDFSTVSKPLLKKTNINATIEETLSQAEAPETVKLVTDLGRLPELMVDKDMIKRCFMNLALNGIQAIEKAGTLKVSTKKTKDFVEISFKDTGTGISEENMKKIFTPFFTTKAKGMGMGLAICKRFIQKHGGSIKVESEEGKGSTFTVRLPIRKENGGEKH